MKNNKQGKKESIHKWDLYKRNAKGVIGGSYYVLNDDELSQEEQTAGLIFSVFATGLLPLTVTAGAGTKTMFDAATRKSMAKQSIAELNEKILGMTAGQLYETAQKICKHGVWSRSSNNLKKFLKEVMEKFKQQFTFFDSLDKKLSELENRTYTLDDINTIIQGAVDCTLYINPGCIKTLNQSQYSLLKVDSDGLKKKWHKEYTSCKIQISTLLVDFISVTENTGKRMQHIIRHAVEDVLENKELSSSSSQLLN